MVLNVRPVDEVVAVHRQEITFDDIRDHPDSVRRTELLTLPGIFYFYAPLFPAAEIIAYLLLAIPHHENKFGYPGLFHLYQEMLENGFAGNRKHNFWPVGGKRAHALPFTRGKNYCFQFAFLPASIEFFTASIPRS
jgi:hypothetical protein